MKGVKTTVGSEKGDIVRSNGSITLYEIDGSNAREYNDAISGDKIGFYTGGKKVLEGYTYSEIVPFNSVNDDLSPYFDGDKYYFLEGMPVSFLPNPNYDYTGVSTAPKKSNDILGTIANFFNTIIRAIGLFSKKKTATSSTDTPDTTTSKGNDNSASEEGKEETFLAKYRLYLFVGLFVTIVGTVVYLVTKNSQKKKLQQTNSGTVTPIVASGS